MGPTKQLRWIVCPGVWSSPLDRASGALDGTILAVLAPLRPLVGLYCNTRAEHHQAGARQC
eukprot:1562976-Lingulodinium_polyedra.AAC.1